MRILVVAATQRELAPPGDWQVLCCGVGPVDAAARTAAALSALRPVAVVHVGIAGARRDSGLVAAPDSPLALAIGTESRYCDLGVGAGFAPGVLTAPATLIAAARRALPHGTPCIIGTSARVGGTAEDPTRPPVEAMEGFAVLRAAALAGIPAIEVRAIANDIEETDRTRWRFDEAFAAIVAATPALVREVAACAN